MKRKTNLFYVNGPDSKFITFSNYTEALTGNFLSTDTKLFPDKFLCLKINNLNNTNKENFIKYLVRYYENKLAVLRDHCVNYDEIQEQHELPLAYLLEAILNICNTDINGFTINNELLFNPYKFTENNNISNISSNLITYVGNITEQDYNGTYTDTICNINGSEYYEGELNFKSSTLSSNQHTCTVEDNTDSLYGWENETMFESYINPETGISITPIYDIDNNTYNFDSYLDSIKMIKQPIYNASSNIVYKDIEFNVIIPLFTITNMNYNTNNSILEDEYYTDTNGNKCKAIILNSHDYLKYDISDNDDYKLIDYKSRKDVPLGMWIYADEDNDTFITLKRDKELNVYPSWSLLIGSQFKPFPYSLKYEKENGINDSILHSYATFAETLTKINDTLDAFNKINTTITKLDSRISSLEKQIKEIGTNSDISSMKTYMFNIYKDTKNEIDTFKQLLHGYVDNITWSSKSKNNN